MQMITLRDWPLANDHLEGLAYCKDPDSISDSICLVVWFSQQLALRVRRSAWSGYCLSNVCTA